MTDIEKDYKTLRNTLLLIRKIIRNESISKGEGYEENEIYNIAVDALNATGVKYGR